MQKDPDSVGNEEESKRVSQNSPSSVIAMQCVVLVGLGAESLYLLSSVVKPGKKHVAQTHGGDTASQSEANPVYLVELAYKGISRLIGSVNGRAGQNDFDQVIHIDVQHRAK
jgi:hypothetical protein